MSSSNHIRQAVEKARAAFKSGKTKDVLFRKRQLYSIERLLSENEKLICEGLEKDLRKSISETTMCEIDVVKNEVRSILNGIDKWVKPQYIPKTIPSMLDTTYIHYEPFGVALILGAWNYPIQLSLSPLLGAIAAGCTAVVKPSEISPATSKIIMELLPQYLDSECYHVVEGGADVATELLSEKWDFIFYTGSTRVGKIVHQAAAKNLTPVVLELGGKSPCYVDDSCPDLEKTVQRIVWGKTLNAGQTCVAPDYILCSKAMQEKLLSIIPKVVKDFFGDDPSKSPDLVRMINDNHFNRLVKLLESTRGRVVFGGQYSKDDRYFSPTFVADVPHDDILMEDELFGPIMPIVAVNSLDDAISFVNEREKPLSLYVFTGKKSVGDRFKNETSSGSICVNDVILHIVVDGFPFGGVGNSGMGSYHGKHSFHAFSHAKSVLVRDFNPIGEALAKNRFFPYTGTKMMIMQQLMRTRNTEAITNLIPPFLFFLAGVVTTCIVACLR